MEVLGRADKTQSFETAESDEEEVEDTPFDGSDFEPDGDEFKPGDDEFEPGNIEFEHGADVNNMDVDEPSEVDYGYLAEDESELSDSGGADSSKSEVNKKMSESTTSSTSSNLGRRPDDIDDEGLGELGFDSGSNISADSNDEY
ncbi:uncharacterized protein PHACADRAFT_189210 [Phanerochaete carnosa HHB-10118-sp]|uniref:Uncharacterized protein n=1 Tax=Phanerochaete carnosa (strain HHB-10118-sp) TaxID=650164 RepID=K5UFU2_PHACS|nr:uncharacterized protein PHACADRAFT_189210 [Phanerochaete carnosa HHB-10118-sp]EKM48296.1 hypothetical protein PHACADRAFT_189210 [Phanerochaete carnosa HHB-10118-sp]